MPDVTCKLSRSHILALSLSLSHTLALFCFLNWNLVNFTSIVSFFCLKEVMQITVLLVSFVISREHCTYVFM